MVSFIFSYQLTPSKLSRAGDFVAPRVLYQSFLTSSKSNFLIGFIVITGGLIFAYVAKACIRVTATQQTSPIFPSKFFPTTRRTLRADSITLAYRLLYYKLQNAEDHPDIGLQAWHKLQQLFDLTLSRAAESKDTSILSISKYHYETLELFLKSVETRTSEQWAAYLDRRSHGRSRELFKDHSYAVHWLRLAAPVKYIDGNWLSRIHNSYIPFNLRRITRIAWQIFSEELGDGDLAKNHVYIYSKLLQSIGVYIGLGNSTTFVDASENPGEDPRVWAAAVAQLALGLFPEELLPEILGFNLAYEAVTLETLICVHELKELKVDPTYFNLHVTIDNADSGHTAMALRAVIELMKTCQNPTSADRMWRRIQAGYILAEGLPVSPRPLTSTEWMVLDIFSKKCGPAKTSHRSCKGKIGGRTLEQWLDPSCWEQRKYVFLEALGSSSWISRGRPEKTKLIQEIIWKGRMFGAFTLKETEVLKDWVVEMADMDRESPWGDMKTTAGLYSRFIGLHLTPKFHEASLQRFVKYDPKLLPDIPTQIPFQGLGICEFPWEILLAAGVPFQYYLSNPTRAATLRGMAVLRILRILNGLGDVGDLVAGMDEVFQPSNESAVDLASYMKNYDTKETSVILGREWTWLEAISIAPEANFQFLVGAQYAITLIMTASEGFKMRDRSKIIPLKDMGFKVYKELERLDLKRNWECERGFWATMDMMTQNCFLN
ncbi:hypothetical protein H072_6854 [Dactylellina haptotyla CBS 200.50]|uniref:Uncharacterized protein n=1 Tax=Dactylellina haptotyla (strain CBS 200.50) TaxID=1284197 RepID=S8A8N5_DACHA|nr:hypothetical protein H072_6854 [Dactylellina haptotyla CBS 200.50]